MCHYPEFGDPLAAAGIDLTLAGHTHGVQICLPGGNPMQHHSRSGTRFVKGLTEIAPSKYIYNTRGLGYSMLSV
jgi:predicted MPP superfamily phosphohydrolase